MSLNAAVKADSVTTESSVLGNDDSLGCALIHAPSVPEKRDPSETSATSAAPLNELTTKRERFAPEIIFAPPGINVAPRVPSWRVPQPAPTAAKWPKEGQPTVHAKAHDIGVLRYAARVFNSEVVGFVTDFADFFSQFATSPGELWKKLENCVKELKSPV